MHHKGIVKLVYARQFMGGVNNYLIAPTAWAYVRSLGQNELFLAFLLSSYNVAAVIGGPLFGRIVDKFGQPRLFFLSTCLLKALSCAIYSINLSPFFPLFAQTMSGLSSGGASAIVYGQVALQTEDKDRGPAFVFSEGFYCLGATFGPAIGSFIAFDVTVLGWHITQGNSPGIVLAAIWTIFLAVAIFLPERIWQETGATKNKTTNDVGKNEAKITDLNLTDVYSKDDFSLLGDDPEYDEPKLNDDQRLSEDELIFEREDVPKLEWNQRILCLLLLAFTSEIFSATATFYVPVLAMNHFRLDLLHVKLLFLNCTLFTLTVFILFYLASDYVDERKLFLVSLGMQISGISLLTSVGFAWHHATFAQNYVLLLYVCLGMPYFAYPFCNSILSKITDPRNASFYQGVSYAALHTGIVLSRLLVSFVNSEESLIIYCFALLICWSVGTIWFSVQYNKFVAGEERRQS